ncbi:hypothetical protein QQS21_010009 [Conoideocrella luteorostrata]|uniref:Enoyl reductase (ER) domain-containing protein n=1 Tax=Conoideocrella luteorostrata TaxID=1105319 RepID=A0AAJ0FUK9_9HYPO|nr:hypothetical protein QQS21_010009 [Conoideocrella luteorostrata]
MRFFHLVKDEIEVKVCASGLNLRDVLLGMKMIPGRQEPVFGYEMADIVRRVGPNVTKLAIGDRVVGGGSERSIATLLTIREVLFEKLPSYIGFVEAAIQVAHMLGAEIYKTVGRDSKVNYLMKTFSLARNRIFNSPNDSFVQGLRWETQGRGAHVALHSLAGEASSRHVEVCP